MSDANRIYTCRAGLKIEAERNTCQITRQKIWEKIFPAESPVSRVDMAKLSGLDLARGSIHCIAINTALYTAEEHTAIDMPHLLKAARREYRKLKKPPKETNCEVGYESE